MKSAVAATILAIAAPALAQSYLDLPTCAQGPTFAALGSTGCQLTDFKCICENEAFVNGLIQAIPLVCSPTETQSALEIAQGICGAQGVTLSIALPGVASSTDAVDSATSTVLAASTTTSVVQTITSAASTTVVPTTSVVVPMNTTGTVIFSNSTTATVIGGTTLSTGSVAPQSTSTRTPAATTSPAPANGAVAQSAGLLSVIGGLVLAFAL